MSNEEAIRIRDALIRSWVLQSNAQQPRAFVLAVGPQGALTLFLSREREIVLLIPLERVPDWQTISGIEDRIKELLSPAEGMFLAGGRNVIHAVLIGGDARVRSWLKQIEFTNVSFRKAVALHHVDFEEETEVWDEPVPLPWLDATLKTVQSQGLSEEPPFELAALHELALASNSMVMENRDWGRIMQRPATFSKAIIFLMVAIFVLQLWWGRGNPDSLILLWLMGACNGRLILEGDVWRLFSPVFLHGGYLHLLFNLLVMVQLGPFLERLLGVKRFLLLFGLSAFAGHIAIALADPDSTGVGASTALCGLISATAVLAWRHSTLFPGAVAKGLRRDLGISLVFIVLMSLVPGISLAAHVGGGLAGVLLMLPGFLVRGVEPLRRPAGPSTDVRADGKRLEFVGGAVTQQTRRPRGGRLEAWLLSFFAFGSAAVLVASFIVGVVVGRPWVLRYPPQFVEVSRVYPPIALELPVSLAEEAHLALDRPDAVTFGTWGHHPLIADIVLTKLDDIDLAMDGRAILSRYAEYIGIKRPYEINKINGYYSLEDFSGSEETLRTRIWLSVRGDHLLIASFLIFPGLPEAWSAGVSRIIEGLTVAPATSETSVTDYRVPETATLDELVEAAHKASAAGENDALLADLERIIALKPDYGEAWTLLGQTCERLERLVDAADAFRRVIKIDPSSPEGYAALGRVLERQKHYEEAESTFRKRHDLEPESVSAILSLGQLLKTREKFAEAVEVLEKGYAARSDHPLLATLLGDVLLSAGQEAHAKEVLKQALEAEPIPIMRNNVAYTLAEHGVELDWALELALQAVDGHTERLREVDPSAPSSWDLGQTAAIANTWDTLGTVFLRMKRLDDAEVFLTVAWQLDENGTIGHHLAETKELKGETGQAAELYAEAVAADSPFEASRARLVALVGEAEAARMIGGAAGALEAMRRVPAERLTVPGTGLKVPEEGQNVPEEGQKVPAEALKVPAEALKVPEEGQKVPGDEPGMQGANQKVPGDGPKVPGVELIVPGDGPKVPGNEPKVAVESNGAPGDGRDLEYLVVLAPVSVDPAAACSAPFEAPATGTGDGSTPIPKPHAEVTANSGAGPAETPPPSASEGGAGFSRTPSPGTADGRVGLEGTPQPAVSYPTVLTDSVVVKVVLPGSGTVDPALEQALAALRYPVEFPNERPMCLVQKARLRCGGEGEGCRVTLIPVSEAVGD